jgi:enoyl-CoA hydratase/carnithine racemase
MPFVDLGLVPEAGSSLLVPQLVGARIAAEWLLLGDRIGAERAAACGLANRVVAAGQALPEAMAVAARLAGKPGGALVATKRLMKSPEQDMHARIEEENRGFQSRLGTEEVRHVINQFFEQRAKATAA